MHGCTVGHKTGCAMAQAVSCLPVTAEVGFDPRSDHVRSMVDKVALGFSPATYGRSLGFFQKAMLFRRALERKVRPRPVITTSVYATPRLYRQTYRGTYQFVTVNHNITPLGSNNARLY